MVQISRIAAAGLWVLALSVTTAVAQRDGAAGERAQAAMMEASPVLRVLDADHDRAISATELANAPSALLTLDKNGDGALTRDEAAATNLGRGGRGREGRGGEPAEQPAPGPTADELLSMLLTFDKNEDGKLQKSEVPERQAGIFERGDVNGDAVLDGAELRKLTAEQAAAPVAPPRAGGRGRGGFGRVDLAAAALDRDGNGTISGDEIAGATAALKVLDRNNDGQITEDEVRPTDPGRGAQ